jgi:hypothetical protein
MFKHRLSDELHLNPHETNDDDVAVNDDDHHESPQSPVQCLMFKWIRVSYPPSREKYIGYWKQHFCAGQIYYSNPLSLSLSLNSVPLLCFVVDSLLLLMFSKVLIHETRERNISHAYNLCASFQQVIHYFKINKSNLPKTLSHKSFSFSGILSWFIQLVPWRRHIPIPKFVYQTFWTKSVVWWRC